MSTSGVSTFNLVTTNIINEAFDLCGIGSEGETVNADMYARALRSLNLIAKAWGASDKLWISTAKSVTLISGQASYALTPKPLRVSEVRRRITASSIDTPLMEWSNSQYLEMPNKTTASVPTAFYYDPQAATGTLYVWPVPSAATAAAMTLQLTYLRRIEDFIGTNDDADFPQEWLLALVYGLAEQLALKYVTRPDLRSEIAGRAAKYKADMEAWDTEPASLYLQPEFYQ